MLSIGLIAKALWTMNQLRERRVTLATPITLFESEAFRIIGISVNMSKSRNICGQFISHNRRRESFFERKYLANSGQSPNVLFSLTLEQEKHICAPKAL